ncbi:hypothetical protein INS49_008322 [Diaporthe citri]|uniref:uncharacterized protein n=1 Tax=Diaporthe citri TaxID=83186 RepID=UPI001C825D8D|nr:uncharacterized protein INS49_008322 [Diaporthe citri]KAG6363226.1 hypothetical protein INS49_008322 [Diaporthe citri]
MSIAKAYGPYDRSLGFRQSWSTLPSVARATHCEKRMVRSPLRFVHVRLAKINTPAARSSRTKVAPTLTPAVAPFESPEELLPCGFAGFAAETELDDEVVAAVFTSKVVVGPAVVIDVIGELELSTVLDVVGSELVDRVELVEELELELVDERELVEVLDVEVLDVDVIGGFFLNGSALWGLLESFARTTSPAGHSLSQALEEQHPKKGLSKSGHVYQSPFESRHSWSVMFAPLSFLKLE